MQLRGPHRGRAKLNIRLAKTLSWGCFKAVEIKLCKQEAVHCPSLCIERVDPNSLFCVMLLGKQKRDTQDTRSPSEGTSYVTLLGLRKAIEELKHSIESGFMEMAAHKTLLIGNTRAYPEARGHI